MTRERKQPEKMERKREVDDTALITRLVESVVGRRDRNDLAACPTMETGLKSERIERDWRRNDRGFYSALLFAIHATRCRASWMPQATPAFSYFPTPCLFSPFLFNPCLTEWHKFDA